MSLDISPVTPCFTPGTPIATDRGLRPVERLKRGDKIVTRDNGLSRIEWIGRRDVSYFELENSRELQPVLVRKDAFGDGLPARDLVVSPNHRFLITKERAPFRVDGPEVLVAARHLIDHRTVKPAPTLGVSYVHMLCSRHQVVLAAGAWTESFHPDDRVMRHISNR